MRNATALALERAEPTASWTSEQDLVQVADVFEPAECEAILAEFRDERDWRQAQITTYVEGETGRELKSILDLERRLARRIHFRDLDMTSRPATRGALEQVRLEVSAMASRNFGFRTDEFGDEEIVRYPVGGKFMPHSDANSLKPYRALSIVFYLNDDYEGGRTSFPDLGYACTPRTGRVLVFPSQLLHAGEPVLAGEKHIIVLWAFYPGGK